MSTSVTSQIEVDDRGVDHRRQHQVTEVVLDKPAHGWSPEEIYLQHPHLSLAQIHSALAYYYEFKETIDDQIERELREADELTAEASDLVFRKKLLALKNTR